VTGTVTLANASDPFNSGCSGTYTFTAIPTVVQPAWGVPPGRTFVDYSPTAHQGLSFNYRSGVVSDLEIEDNFTCGGATEDAVEVNASAYGFTDIHTSANGSFRMQTLVLDEYKDILRMEVTGRITAHHATGRILISEPAGGYSLLGQAGQTCGGNRGWSATPTSELRNAPEAFFQWIAIRIPVGAAYRYYFAVTGLRCAHGATEVALSVAHRTRTVSCRQSTAWASGPLTPGVSYPVSARALKL